MLAGPSVAFTPNLWAAASLRSLLLRQPPHTRGQLSEPPYSAPSTGLTLRMCLGWGHTSTLPITGPNPAHTPAAHSNRTVGRSHMGPGAGEAQNPTDFWGTNARGSVMLCLLRGPLCWPGPLGHSWGWTCLGPGGQTSKNPSALSKGKYK